VLSIRTTTRPARGKSPVDVSTLRSPVDQSDISIQRLGDSLQVRAVGLVEPRSMRLMSPSSMPQRSASSAWR